MLHTQRLDLIPASLEHIDAELRGPAWIGRLLEAQVPEGWPPGEYDRDALEFFRAKLLAGGPAEQGWYTWYGTTRNAQGNREWLVAGAGYFGPPSNGTVEVGYSVVPAFRNHGYATEMLGALVDRAFEDPSVKEVVAHTTEANAASIKVLRHCGFHKVGPGTAPDSILFRRART